MNRQARWSGVRGAQLAVEPTIPVAASKAGGEKRWRPVELYEGIVGVCGGFGGSKPWLANAIDVQSPTGPMRFMEVAKHFEWVVKAVAGPKAQRGDLKNVRVLDDVREKLLSARDQTAAVAEDDEDPMAALDELDSQLVKVAKPRRGAMKRSVPEVVSLQMPTRPLCVGSTEDTGVTTIYVYWREEKARSDPKKRAVHIRTDCLDWFLSYAADEYHHQGIVDTAVAEDAAPEGNGISVRKRGGRNL
jgi:hypothetical protein